MVESGDVVYSLFYDNGADYSDNAHVFYGIFVTLESAQSFAEKDYGDIDYDFTTRIHPVAPEHEWEHSEQSANDFYSASEWWVWKFSTKHDPDSSYIISREIVR